MPVADAANRIYSKAIGKGSQRLEGINVQDFHRSESLTDLSKAAESKFGCLFDAT